VVELTKAARENTEATEIYLILGNLLREKGQLERAIQIHQSVLHRRAARTKAHAPLPGMTKARAHRAADTSAKSWPFKRHALTNLVKIHERSKGKGSLAVSSKSMGRGPDAARFQDRSVSCRERGRRAEGDSRLRESTRCA
jgi:hypothetical protein